MAGLSEILRAELSARQWTAYQLAHVANINLSTAYDLTNDKTRPTITTLDRVLLALGHDYAWLHKQGYRPQPALDGTKSPE